MRDVFRRRSVQLRVGIGVVAVVLLLIGLALGRATVSASTPLHYSGTLTGTVESIETDLSSMCVDPSGGRAQVCEGLMSQPGTRIAAGQRVKVAITWIDTGGGSRQEMFVLLEPLPHL